jgi:hypothetical protein
MKKTFVLLTLTLLCSGQVFGNLPIIGGLLPATGLGGIVGGVTATLGISTILNGNAGGGAFAVLNLNEATSVLSPVTNIAGGLLNNLGLLPNVGSDIQFILKSASGT